MKLPRSAELFAFHNPGHDVWSHGAIVHYDRMVIIDQRSRDGTLVFHFV